MGKLLYQGHSSLRIVSAAGTVIYFDPYAGKGYDMPADGILISHEHGDHNKTKLVKLSSGGKIYRPANMLMGGEYKKCEIGDVSVKAVPAGGNRNHSVENCVGYIITVDGVKIYAAGDTSYLDFMKDELSKEHIDYAFLPTDGKFNMGNEEASKCAEVIGAKHTIPVHNAFVSPFNVKKANRFKGKNAMVMIPGQEIEL